MLILITIYNDNKVQQCSLVYDKLHLRQIFGAGTTAGCVVRWRSDFLPG